MSASLYWFKSSYSTDEGECLEVALHPTPAGETPTIHIRDSKNPTGLILHLHPATWTAFLAAHSPLGRRT
ncbi:DUF397 domain-containing protein [Streptomyces alboflavus]|uniref:DUF397 domain-containing protein n=1 Tax=Streptomyces alboflavus TaxID=67267 RepID=UPI0036BA3FCC